MQTLPWIVALAALCALTLGLVLALWTLRPGKAKAADTLPTEWALAARPVFSADERRVYRLLREALPHHVVLAKLPLVRFCQPTDPARVTYWYELLGANHVTFAICSPNGRVLAGVDIDTGRHASRRVLRIKQSVLAACRVRYLRCPVDQLPTVAELQLLVPHASATARGPQHASAAPPAPRHAAVPRRAERTALWQDSSFAHDSFFTPDSRMDGGSEFSSLTGVALPGSPRNRYGLDRPALEGLDVDDDIGGVVDDHPPRYASGARY